MIEAILRIAASIGTPLALGGFVVAVLYLIYNQLLSRRLSRVAPERTFLLLNRIARYLFFLALTAVVVGVAAYVIVSLARAPSADVRIEENDTFSHSSKGEPLGYFAEWVEENSVYHVRIDSVARGFKLCHDFEGTVAMIFNEIQQLYPACLRIEIVQTREKNISISAIGEFICENVHPDAEYECSRCKP